MSLEAMVWVFRLKIPPKPKMILMALADQTDSVSGRVCYGKTDAASIAAKSSVPERSLVRWMAALIRNGYVIRERAHDDNGHRKASRYWLCMDRDENLPIWDWKAKLDDDDPQDVDDQDAAVAVRDSDDPYVPNDASLSAIDGACKSHLKPDYHSALASQRPTGPTSFNREVQKAQIQNQAIKRAAEKANARVFVIENSKAWGYWVAWRRKRGMVPSMPTCSHEIDGKRYRGWWMPSLYPRDDSPSTTGPPKPVPGTLMTEEDFAEMGKGL